MQHYRINPILEEDTDEILLMLLANDNEPLPKRYKPHRRYVAPAYMGTEHQEHAYYKDMFIHVWRCITDDWWLKDGDNYGRPHT